MTGRRSNCEYFGDVTDYENDDYDTDEDDYLTWRPLLNVKGHKGIYVCHWKGWWKEITYQYRIQKLRRGGAKKDEILAAAFGGHLFFCPIFTSRGGGGMGAICYCLFNLFSNIDLNITHTHTTTTTNKEGNSNIDCIPRVELMVYWGGGGGSSSANFKKCCSSGRTQDAFHLRC